MIWIKGHAGLINNEKVDILAKDAVESGDHIPGFRIPCTDFVRLTKDKLYKEWQKMFKETTTGQFYKGITQNINKKPWFTNQNNKNFIRIMNRLRCNHALYPVYKHRIGLIENSNCECGETGDMQHCILNCTLKSALNREFYTKIKDYVQFPISLQYLLGLGDMEIYQRLYNHVQSLKINL